MKKIPDEARFSRKTIMVKQWKPQRFGDAKLANNRPFRDVDVAIARIS